MNGIFSSSAARRNLAIALGVLLLAAVIYLTTRPPQEESTIPAAGSPKATSNTRAQGLTSTVDATTSTGANPSPSGPASQTKSQDTTGDEIALARTATNRNTTTASGVRKQLIDPMASWTEQPAWPEGPRMFAEVETAGKRYVNLRPDDVGEMPRIQIAAQEQINITISVPDGDPGEKIHVELPNGGSFTDSESKGRIFILSENRTLAFPYTTDRVLGYCNVKLRHRGHTRSLPIWVGELPISTPDP
jgi:hypothetical protein